MPEHLPVRYRSPDEDSARWSAVELRVGDVVLDTAELARYRRRAAALAPPDLLAWLHGEAPAPG